MTLAAIDWLSISINLLLVFFVIVCLLMTLLILMQRPKQEGLGAAFGGGVTDQVFGARTTNVLQRGTVYLGSLFFILALTLAVLIGHKNKKTSIIAKTPPPAAAVEKAKPEEPTLPKSLTSELPVETPAPETPAVAAPETPATPAVPEAPATAPETPAQPAPPADALPATDAPAPAPSTEPSPPAETSAPAAPAPAAPEDKSGQP